jgi:hypothetical protein
LLTGQPIFYIPVVFFIFLLFILLILSSSVFPPLVQKSTCYELLEKKLGFHEGLGGRKVFEVDREPEGKGEVKLILLHGGGGFEEREL